VRKEEAHKDREMEARTSCDICMCKSQGNLCTVALSGSTGCSVLFCQAEEREG
jgi:hypothetical protein